MKTLEIEIALVKILNKRQNIIVPNVSWGIGLHECDILTILRCGDAIEYEIKVSRADFIKDFKKGHHHKSDRIRELYFVVPIELKELAFEMLSPEIGIITCKYYDSYNPYTEETIENDISINWDRNAIPNKNAIKLTDKEILHVAHLGCMRVWNLKEKLNKNIIRRQGWNINM